MVIDWNILTNLIVIKVYKVRVLFSGFVSFFLYWLSTCSNMYLISNNLNDLQELLICVEEFRVVVLFTGDYSTALS